MWPSNASRQSQSTQQGFTLIEMLIAIAIFSLISLGSYQVLQSVLVNDEQSQRLSGRLKEIQRAYQFIQSDLMQMSRRRVRIAGNAPQKRVFWAGDGLLESDSGAIMLTRLGWRNPAQMLPRGTVQSVAYQVREGVLERLYRLYPDEETDTKVNLAPLLTGVESLGFEFYAGDKWLSQWDKEAVPDAIAVVLTLEDYGELRWLFLLPGDPAPGVTGS